MQEYKHTDVFYVKVRPVPNLKEKSVDHSELAQSTNIHSDRAEPPVFNTGVDAPQCDEDCDTLVLHGDTPFRLFGLYFYKISVEYAGRIFVDRMLLERDALCDNFFELYVKQLLADQLRGYFVTHHEANSELTRTQADRRGATVCAVQSQRRTGALLLQGVCGAI